MPFKVLNQRTHQGVSFVEVEEVNDLGHAGPVHLAVPGSFAPGTFVNIQVTAVEAPPVVEPEPVVATAEAPAEEVKEEPKETSKAATKKGK